MNGSHIAGAGVGGFAGTVVAALGTKIGLHLDETTAASIAAFAAGVGLALGHAAGKAWDNPGIFPALRRGFFGGKPSKS